MGNSRAGLRLIQGLGLGGAGTGEVVAIPEAAIEEAGELGGAGPEDRTAALEEEDGYEAALGRIGEGREPAETGAFVGAGAGFAEDGELVEVDAEAAGGAVLDCAGHAVLEVGDEAGDVKGALDAGLEAGGFFGGGGVLEVVEGSTVGDGGDEGSELERGEIDAL